MMVTDREHFERLRDLFMTVCDQPPSARAEALDVMCNGNARLRHDVEELLAREEQSGLDLDSAAEELNSLLKSAAGRQSADALPERIGPLRVIDLLGEGGMGVVYLAEQDRPKRTVAVKVIRAGFATRELSRRLEHEAQLLARLQHPGIAQVFGVGTEQTRGTTQPYLVMEYVRGRPLLEYARAKKLPREDRLRLLANICDAVQHAHQRGVIHRDLKPANILVDESGQPKILDFGVARATDPDLALTTIGGRSDRLVGTLAYMSPEQLRGEDIDTRTDVYALGVIAFELLSGELPHDLHGLSLPAMMHALRDRPPRALREMGTAYRGDLEVIVGKAMEADSDRRYQTARELASDIRAFLRNEPIDARRNSVLYLLRKRMRRYRGAVVASTCALLGLLAFATYAMVQAHRFEALAQSEVASRVAADQARYQAEAARRDAEQSEEAAAHERDAAQAVTRFLVNMLGLADPNVTQTFDTSVRDMLEGASLAVGRLFAGLPEAEAEIRGHLGRIYATLGDLEEAEQHLRKAVRLREVHGVRDDTEYYELLWPYLHVLIDLNDILYSVPRLRAERLGRSLLREYDPVLHDLCAQARSASTRQPLSEVSVMIDEIVTASEARLTPEEPAWRLVADQLHLYGLAHKVNETWAAAAAFYEPALEMYRSMLPETDSRIARTMGDLIDALLAGGEYERAERLTQEALDRLHRLLGDDHWYSALHQARLGRAMLGRGQYDAAGDLLRSAFEQLAAERGKSSPYVTEIAAALIEHADSTGLADERERWRSVYAHGLAAAVSIPTLGQLRVALGPEHEPLYLALSILPDCLAARSEECGSRVEAARNLVVEEIDPAGPAAGLVADVFVHWSHRAAQAGFDDFNVTLLMAREAARIAEVNGHRHLRKQAGAYWWISAVQERLGLHDAGIDNAKRSLEFILAQQSEHYAFNSAAESLLAAHLSATGRVREAWEFIVPAYEGLAAVGQPGDIDALIAFGRALRIAVQNGLQDDAHVLIEGHFQLLSGAPNPSRSRRTAAWQVIQTGGLIERSYELAAAVLSELEDAFHHDPMTVLMRGAASYRLGAVEAAVETLRAAQTAQDAESTEPYVSGFLAMALNRAGDTGVAQELLSRVGEMRDKQGGAWRVLSEWHAQELAAQLGVSLPPLAER